MELKYLINTSDYPVGGCCAIASIQWFNSDDWPFWENPGQVEKIEKEIAAYEEDIVAKGKSIAFASVNSEQTKAAEMLERLGYVCPFEGWAKRSEQIHPRAGGVRIYAKPVYKTVELAEFIAK